LGEDEEVQDGEKLVKKEGGQLEVAARCFGIQGVQETSPAKKTLCTDIWNSPVPTLSLGMIFRLLSIARLRKKDDVVQSGARF
jgi:hypothetical protein